MNKERTFGTAPVFFTAISTILGAILFLRFGYAVGTLGFWGVFIIIILGHLITIPTALAISEIATNQRVEGGGEYFIISRSFGINIGATIGISLYLSQTISVAFYTIAFTEAFQPILKLVEQNYGILLPKQAISVPTMILLSVLVLKKGADLGMKTLYLVITILFASIILFFMGSPEVSAEHTTSFMSFTNSEDFFKVFAICFPAFTGMTAGVGLSGDLKDPKKSIPAGTLLATISGMIIYIFIIWKLSVSASTEDLINDQLVMSRIAIWGDVIIPLGLAASTLSSAIGSILVAPRTLQALGRDNAIPFAKVNQYISKGKGKTDEPVNASFVTVAIGMVFVMLGDVNAVASIISMFFMVTYGSICLISFLHHFGADPSYRPKFRSRWYISFLGFLLCVWMMFQMDPIYAVVSFVIMTILYVTINNLHKDREGLQAIFESAFFQISRKIQLVLQNSKKNDSRNSWKPAAISISRDTFERDKVFNFLKWISYKYGFGTYIHLIDGYYSQKSVAESKFIKDELIKISSNIKSNIFVDTIISPSFTSAIAQAIQLPSPSGLENNMIVLEFSKKEPDNLTQIVQNIPLALAGNYDICIYGSSTRTLNFNKEIHVWLRNFDEENSNLMIMLSYIILSHPDWSGGSIKIFQVCKEDEIDEVNLKLKELTKTGRLPITEKNIEVIPLEENLSFKDKVNKISFDAGLVIVGFRGEQLKNVGEELFLGYDSVGDILFINTKKKLLIE